ncbi:DUF2860 family protein [Rheinheimera sp.]|uniref:DUF2860 family protein n=1 Tax=Rheinheimera sp. TaxID=1869214 RepID=UPI003D2A2F2F
MGKVMISKKAVFSPAVYVLAATFSLPCYSVFAAASADKAGWGGEVFLVPVSLTQKSQFAAEHENRRTADLNNSGKTINLFSAFPLTRLEYTPGSSQTSFFFGNGQDNVTKRQIALEFGLVHSLSQHSKITFAMFPELPFSGETWKDPFLTGQDRQETNERAAGGRLKFEHAGDYPFDVQYAFAKNSIDIEESGRSLMQLNQPQRSMLNRNAEFHRFNVNMNFTVGDGVFFVPGLQITTSEAQGDANDFAEGTLILQSLYIKERHFLSASMRVGKKESSLENPIFNLPQDDRTLSLDAVYKYSEPLGYKNWSLLGVAIWNKSDANITFYDSQSAVLGIGLGFTW